MIKSVSKSIVAVMTVLFILYPAVPAGAWPECGDCERWNGDQCVPYGNCEGGCPNCYACAGCWCECASECCGDSDCGEPNCWSCVNCGCENQCTGSCQSCVDGSCKVCGGDPDQICCDGGCRPKCHEWDDETSCSSANDEPCVACVGIFGDCSTYATWVYTNAVTHGCSGGCLGDCHDVEKPVCYRLYKCGSYIHYVFAECGTGGEIPGPLDCYSQEVMPWSCTRCAQGDLFGEGRASSNKRCPQ